MPPEPAPPGGPPQYVTLEQVDNIVLNAMRKDGRERRERRSPSPVAIEARLERAHARLAADGARIEDLESRTNHLTLDIRHYQGQLKDAREQLVVTQQALHGCIARVFSMDSHVVRQQAYSAALWRQVQDYRAVLKREGLPDPHPEEVKAPVLPKMLNLGATFEDSVGKAVQRAGKSFTDDLEKLMVKLSEEKAKAVLAVDKAAAKAKQEVKQVAADAKQDVVATRYRFTAERVMGDGGACDSQGQSISSGYQVSSDCEPDGQLSYDPMYSPSPVASESGGRSPAHAPARANGSQEVQAPQGSAAEKDKGPNTNEVTSVPTASAGRGGF